MYLFMPVDGECVAATRRCLRRRSGLHRVPSGRVTQILNGKRAVTPETALRLARYFGNSPQFWMNLQTKHDLLVTERKIGERIKVEVDEAA